MSLEFSVSPSGKFNNFFQKSILNSFWFCSQILSGFFQYFCALLGFIYPRLREKIFDKKSTVALRRLGFSSTFFYISRIPNSMK